MKDNQLVSGPAESTIGNWIDYCCDQLAAADLCFGHGTDNPWDEAVQLVLSCTWHPLDSDVAVLAEPVADAQQSRIQQLLARRIDERIPMPYLLGCAWFAGLPFFCDQRALVPRSPLAELIGNDFAPWYAGPAPRQLLDLCCGGGSIGIAAAVYHPALEVDLLDLSDDALALARDNIQRHGVGQRVNVERSDLFAAAKGKRYDIILSNPPYVDAEDLATMPAEYHHEPPMGLGSGDDGLDITRRLLAQAGQHLEPHGLLVVEVGNSWQALEQAFPQVAFTWLEFENGGHGVFALNARELQDYSASFIG